jgi:hypothetical protein
VFLQALNGFFYVYHSSLASLAVRLPTVASHAEADHKYHQTQGTEP